MIMRAAGNATFLPRSYAGAGTLLEAGHSSPVAPERAGLSIHAGTQKSYA